MKLTAAVILPPANESLTATLRASDTHLARAILERSVRSNERTVGSELLARAFVERYVRALSSGDWNAFFDWIEGACERYHTDTAMLRIVSGGAEVLARHIEGATLQAAVIEQARFVCERTGSIVTRPRKPGGLIATAALDEIDTKIERLILRLTNFDAATADHSRAVSMWCARIGKRLGLTTSDTIFVTRAGLIHDIGKITTPPEILNAPYRLSDQDMEIMRRHAEAGADLIRTIRPLEHLTPVVRAHHERIDGRGYPDRRAGSEIPIVARIVSVADSFNAMIGNRPYRLPMAPTAAIEQLKLHSGTQFDPNVVNAMIEVVERNR